VPTTHQWIDTLGELEAFCADIREGDVIAVDTESDHFFAYRPYVALIQIATVDAAALVDPLALPDDLEPLLELVENAGVVTIMHSARNDIGELDRDWGIEAANIFDTQLAARLLGYEKFSLDALLGLTAGIKLNKKYQRFDWARRPIPAPARDYAVGDVVHLFDLRDRLLRELEAEGWMEAFTQQSQRLVEVSGHSPNEFDPERWRKLKGSKDLDDRSRATLAALYVYRHELCERIDRAPLHVLENGAMLRIAQQRPTSRSQLEGIRGVRANTLRRNADDILAVVAESLDAPIPPGRAPRTGGGRRPSPAENARLKALSAARQELAAQVGLAPDFVVTRAALGSTPSASCQRCCRTSRSCLASS
jgi:ribonuclease D